jgi:hypothetical protein
VGYRIIPTTSGVENTVGRVSQAKELKKLKEESGRLKKAVADLTLDKLILNEALSSNRRSRSENGFIERFNGTLRDELLNREVFYTLAEARAMTKNFDGIIIKLDRILH